jgi:hypothetical protein
MICQRCNKEVPPTKIACTCFPAVADEETKLHALMLFKESKQPLYLTNSNNGKHLLARRDRTRSFCGAKEFKQPATTPLWLSTFEKMAQHDCCITCAAIVTRSFAVK